MIAHVSYLLVAALSLPLAVAEAAKLDSVLDVPEFVHDWQISKQFTIDVSQSHARRSLRLQTESR